MMLPLLLEAQQIISGDRQETYGDAKTGFTHIAAQWTLYLFQKYGVDVIITAEDVCWMMADLKKVRQLTKAKRDNLVDALGYIALVEQVQ